VPLYPSARDLIRVQVERLARGERVSIISIGFLTNEQHETLNRAKTELGLPPLEIPELLYIGRHQYESRVVKDGYAFDDLYRQLEAALSATSIVSTNERSTTVVSQVLRDDGYGNRVRDVAVLELASRKPRAEVYSTIPKNDGGGPKRKAP